MINRLITDIVIHCAATPNGRPVHVGQIDEMHATRVPPFHRSPDWMAKWNPSLRAIGYHFFIGVDGSRASGRHLDEVGAHVEGSNARSIGICMAGTDRFTGLQWATLKYLAIDLARQLADGRIKDPLILTPLDSVAAYQQLGVRVQGHRDFSPDKNGDGVVEPWEWLKTCPGFDVASWLQSQMTAAPANLC